MDDKKQCRKCKEVKSYKDFHKNRTKKDGYQDRCIACRSTAVIDTEVIKGINKRCTLCNVVKHLDEFHNDRGSKVAERSVKGRLSKINAKIPCLTDNDLNWIAQIYKQRDTLQKYTGDIYNVDHAIPIQGVDVCGLHVPWNLTVMHQSENARKKNKVFTWEWLALTPWNEHIWLELQKEKYKE